MFVIINYTDHSSPILELGDCRDTLRYAPFLLLRFNQPIPITACRPHGKPSLKTRLRKRPKSSRIFRQKSLGKLIESAGSIWLFLNLANDRSISKYKEQTNDTGVIAQWASNNDEEATSKRNQQENSWHHHVDVATVPIYDLYLPLLCFDAQIYCHIRSIFFFVMPLSYSNN